MKKGIYLLSRLTPKTTVWFFILLLLTSCNTFSEIIKQPNKIEEFPQTTTKEDPIYFDFIAKYFYNRGEYKQAIYFYELLYNEYMRNKDEKAEEISWVLYEIGFCYLKQNKIIAAERKFSQALSLGGSAAVVKLSEARLQEIEKMKK